MIRCSRSASWSRTRSSCRYYPLAGGEGGDPAPNPALLALLRDELEGSEGLYHAGPMWTTDAIYPETPELVRHLQTQGLLRWT